jgi:predicted phosphate transport protein (TIGR00153 family)
MTGRWSRLWRDLTGRSDEVFIQLLQAQVSISLKAAKALRDAQQHDELPDEVREEIHRLEDEGDEQRTTMLTEMGRALMTPIDREDLFRLSHSLDDVLDNLRDFTVELDRYGAEPSERFTAPLDAIAQGLQQMEHAIAELREGTDEVTAAARAAKHANDARSAYHDSMAELLHEEEVTMRTLRQRELLRRLDIAGLRLGEAADALTSGALKRG